MECHYYINEGRVDVTEINGDNHTLGIANHSTKKDERTIR